MYFSKDLSTGEILILARSPLKLHCERDNLDFHHGQKNYVVVVQSIGRVESVYDC